MKQKKALVITAVIATFISAGSFIGFNSYKTSRFNELVKQAQTCEDKHDFENALTCYQAALKIKDDSSIKEKLSESQLSNQCANLYTKGDYSGAVKAADSLLKLNSSNSHAIKVKNDSAAKLEEAEKKQEAEKKKQETEKAKQQEAMNASTAAASQDEVRQYVIKTLFEGNPNEFTQLAICKPFVFNGATYYPVNYELNIPSRRCNQLFLDYTNKKYVQYYEMDNMLNAAGKSALDLFNN